MYILSLQGVCGSCMVLEGGFCFMYNKSCPHVFPQPQKVVQEVTEEQQVRRLKTLKARRVVQFCFDEAAQGTGSFALRPYCDFIENDPRLKV